MKFGRQSTQLFILVLAGIYTIQSLPVSTPPVVTIPLDQPVDIRLKDLIAKYKDTYRDDFNDAMSSVKMKTGSLRYWIGRIIMGFYMNVKGDSTIYEELAEVSDVTGVSFNDLVMFNYFYEIGCTSIIAYSSDQQSLLFGSNLDYDYEKFLRKYSFQGNYTKNGQTVFIGESVFGMVGVVRGQRINNGYDTFSIAINERDVERGTPLMSLFVSDAYEASYLIRKALSETSYNDALELLKTQKLATAAYYTIGGTISTGGCVLERSAHSLDNIYCLNGTDDQSTWFLVQTNYDRSLPDPSDDYRRIPTENRIKSIGTSNFDRDALYNLLTTSPLHRNSTELYRTIATVVCENKSDQRLYSTWKMVLWDDLS